MSDHSRRRVVVLRDFSYTERQGEEELAIERFLEAAPEHINLFTELPEFDHRQEAIENADVVISFGLKRYPDQVFEWILEHPKHIHVAQDWWEPLQPQSDWRNRIVESASMVIFMSPLHAERYERIYQVKPRDARIIPFPMLERDWAPAAVDFTAEEAVLWCAPWHPDNGNDLMIRWAEREVQQVHAYGLEVPTATITPHVEARGALALDAAPRVFQSYSRFVFFPRTPVPFGLPVLLALMLGLEVSYSGEIGCLSYGPIETVTGTKKASLPDHCRLAPATFWNLIEEVAA